jgi:hypothetical protein
MIRRPFWLAILLCLTVLAPLGCSSSPDKPDDSLTEDKARVPAFFEYIPSTTPYVVTSLEPFPMEILEPYLEVSGELYEAFNKQLKSYGQNYEQHMEPPEKFMVALFEELSKVRTVEGYTDIGLSTQPQGAIYGIGWFPVFRLTLDDSAAFEAMLSRLESSSGLEVRMRTVGEQSYRQYDLGEEAKMAVAITDTEFVAGISHTAAFDEFVAYMLGHKRPARSLADVDAVQHIQNTYDFLPYAVGYIDIEGIAAVATGAAPEDEITRKMNELSEFNPMELTEQCRGEWMGLFEAAPRMVLGYTELTREQVEMTTVIETTDDLAVKLAATRAPMPAYASSLVEQSLFAVGSGVDVEKLTALIVERAERINNDPFECPDFEGINDIAQQAAVMRQMVPPVVTGLRGAIAVVTSFELDPQTFQPAGFDGLTVVETADPLGLLAQVQQLVPELQGVAPKDDGVPVAIDALGDFGWLEVPHLAMTSRSLAMSAGVGMQDDMAIHLEGATGDDAAASPLMLVAYDYGELMEQVYGQRNAMMVGGAFGGAIEGMQKMFGTVIAELDASKEGIIMRYRMQTFPDREAGATR